MFAVSEADAAAIRATFDQGGRTGAATVELRRLFPGITDKREHQAMAWFEKCYFRVTLDLTKAAPAKGFHVLSVTLL